MELEVEEVGLLPNHHRLLALRLNQLVEVGPLGSQQEEEEQQRGLLEQKAEPELVEQGGQEVEEARRSFLQTHRSIW